MQGVIGDTGPQEVGGGGGGGGGGWSNWVSSLPLLLLQVRCTENQHIYLI